jgi:hypothetical protein
MFGQHTSSKETHLLEQRQQAGLLGRTKNRPRLCGGDARHAASPTMVPSPPSPGVCISLFMPHLLLPPHGGIGTPDTTHPLHTLHSPAQLHLLEGPPQPCAGHGPGGAQLGVAVSRGPHPACPRRRHPPHHTAPGGAAVGGSGGQWLAVGGSGWQWHAVLVTAHSPGAGQLRWRNAAGCGGECPLQGCSCSSLLRACCI